MSLREYQRGDYLGVADLWERNPSDEAPLLGLNSTAVGEMLHKGEGLGFRFILGMARSLRRPIIVVLIVDTDGKVSGTTMLTFTPQAGYVSGVVVDSTVRRQGHAQAMLRTCDTLCERYHRPYVVLDVLSQNDPALKLYTRLGYQPLRESFWFSRSLGPDEILPQPSGRTRVRPFRRNDGPRLAELDNAQMSADVRGIVPRRPKDYQLDPLLQSVMRSESEAWVIEAEGRPVGFARATVSPTFAAAQLIPLLLPVQDQEASRDLLLTALGWIHARKAPRVVTDLPQHRIGSRSILESAAFVESFHLRTLVRKLPS
jgi:ribosomal protein S18 acetylase RimI-like enzyme